LVGNPLDMKSKKQPGKQVLDITRPKKRPAASAPSVPQVIIQKRSIIPVTEPEDTPVIEPLNTKQAAKDLQPETMTAPPVAAAPEVQKDPALKPDEASEPPKVEQAPEEPQPEPEAKAKPPEEEDETEESSAETKPADTEAEPEADEAEGEDSDPDADASSDADGKANPHVRKALEEAKRQQEIQEYIDNKEFFVPINAIARKRSLRVSIGLTFLELLLGLVLLNLMLDAGLIQLLEKIPHTNFFDLH
jgi:hypothetical protein